MLGSVFVISDVFGRMFEFGNVFGAQVMSTNQRFVFTFNMVMCLKVCFILATCLGACSMLVMC